MLKILVLATVVIASFDSATNALAQPQASSRTVELLNFSASIVEPDQLFDRSSDPLRFNLVDKVTEPTVTSEFATSARTASDDILGQLRLDFDSSQSLRPSIPFVEIGYQASPSACTQSVYRAAAFLPPRIEARRRLLYPLVAQSACRHGLPIALLDALIIQESGYNWSARSHVGAYGLAQLMPATARDLGVNRYSVVANLDGGARYLKSQLERFRAPHLALAAYNAGPSRVERRWAVPDIAETRNYVLRITKIWRDLSQHISPIVSYSPVVAAHGSVAERYISVPRVRSYRGVELARF